MTGNIVSPNTQDPYTLNINWGDGQTSQVKLAAGATSFVLGHTYLDAQAPDSVYTVTASVTDTNDNLSSGPVTTSAEVLNVAPIISGITLSAPNILENGTETISGLIIDPGVNDTETVTINWGDGTATMNATVNQTTRTFTATHQYLDDSLPGAVSSTVNGEHAGTYTVTINDTDTDGGSTQATTSVTVQNVAPLIGQLTVADAHGAATMTPNNPIVLSGTIVDPGRSIVTSSPSTGGMAPRRTLTFRR